jgi:uncharacterized membrane protein YccF (DUF307 family)
MRLLGNIIWFVFGGVLVALEYLISSILLMITIIGIPFGLQTLKMAGLALWPFDKRVVTHDRASGLLRILFNVIWILIGGFWIAVTHLFFGIIFAVTIIGIPFAQQHFKLAGLALVPFGKDVKSN